MRVAVLTGLAIEAGRFAAPATDAPYSIAAGPGVRARAVVEAALAEGAEALLGFGLAGGLDHAVGTGSVVVADAVQTPDGREVACERAWCRRIAERIAAPGRDVRIGRLLGADRVLTLPAEKRALGAGGALAVDTESHHLARLAAAAGRPFAVVRVVVDRVDDRLPDFVADGYDDAGRLRPMAMARGLVRRPADLPALLRLAGQSRRALAVLGGVGRLGAGLVAR